MERWVNGQLTFGGLYCERFPSIDFEYPSMAECKSSQRSYKGPRSISCLNVEESGVFEEQLDPKLKERKPKAKQVLKPVGLTKQLYPIAMYIEAYIEWR